MGAPVVQRPVPRATTVAASSAEMMKVAVNNVLEVNMTPPMMKTADHILHIRANVDQLKIGLVSRIGSCYARVGLHWRVLFSALLRRLGQADYCWDEVQYWRRATLCRSWRLLTHERGQRRTLLPPLRLGSRQITQEVPHDDCHLAGRWQRQANAGALEREQPMWNAR